MSLLHIFLVTVAAGLMALCTGAAICSRARPTPGSGVVLMTSTLCIRWGSAGFSAARLAPQTAAMQQLSGRAARRVLLVMDNRLVIFMQLKTVLKHHRHRWTKAGLPA